MKELLILLASVAIAVGQPLSGLSGTVVNAVDGLPLPGVKVSPYSGNQSATTDPSGRFQLSGLKPGNVHLNTEKPGFVRSHLSPGPAIRLAPGESASGLLIQLAPEATISGRVVNAKGEPGGASLFLMAAGTDVAVAGKNMSGEFRLEGLYAGEYYLAAQALGTERY